MYCKVASASVQHRRRGFARDLTHFMPHWFCVCKTCLTIVKPIVRRSDITATLAVTAVAF